MLIYVNNKLLYTVASDNSTQRTQYFNYQSILAIYVIPYRVSARNMAKIIVRLLTIIINSKDTIDHKIYRRTL